MATKIKILSSATGGETIPIVSGDNILARAELAATYDNKRIWIGPESGAIGDSPIHIGSPIEQTLTDDADLTPSSAAVFDAIANVVSNVGVDADGGLAELTTDNFSLKNAAGLTDTSILKWNNTANQLEASGISETSATVIDFAHHTLTVGDNAGTTTLTSGTTLDVASHTLSLGNATNVTTLTTGTTLAASAHTVIDFAHHTLTVGDNAGTTVLTTGATLDALTTDTLNLGDNAGATLITGGSTITIDPAATGVTGTVVIAGDLTVTGTTTTVNSTTVEIGDNIILLNKDEAGAPSADAGFEIERGTSLNVSFLWDEAADKFTVGSETMVAATFEGALTGDVTGNADTASAWATSRTVTFATGDTTGNFTIDGSGDVSNVALTTTTATSSVLGIASFNTDNFLVTAGDVTIVIVDGGTF